jgi:hypothetical protein
MAGWYRSAAKTTCKSRPGSGVLSFVRRRAVRDQLGRCHPYRDAPSDLERLARIVSLPGCSISEVPFNTKTGSRAWSGRLRTSVCALYPDWLGDI